MASYYDEVEIEDFDYDEDADMYTYPCPCGDKFLISGVSMILWTLKFHDSDHITRKSYWMERILQDVQVVLY